MSREDILKHVLTSLLIVGKNTPGQRVQLPLEHIEMICHEAREMFASEPSLLRVSAPVVIVGDIHGQYYDLLRIFESQGVPPEKNFVFLGDYVDRGKYSIEVMTLLMALKLKYPKNIHLLRGNHECSNITKMYGFYDECKRRYNVKLWKTFIGAFEQLPISAVVGNRIFCVHGGISPDIDKVEEVNTIKRPTEIPEEGPLCDLLWSDPESGSIGWKENDRGVSYIFGQDTTERFLKMNDLDLICRAHQVVEQGYEFCYGRKVITVFSAPSYCGEMDNAGAVLIVDKDLKCRISAIKAVETVSKPL